MPQPPLLGCENTSQKTGNDRASLFDPIAADLARVDQVLRNELRSRYPFVNSLVDHVAGYQGKRLRPALLLLVAKAVGNVTEEHMVLAAVVEMIHTATLVHDDVLDQAVVRRHKATVNAEWGTESSVLLGDYLFTHAFHLAASLESTLACRVIGRCKGGERLERGDHRVRGEIAARKVACLHVAGFRARRQEYEECNEDQKRISEEAEKTQADGQDLADHRRELGRTGKAERHRQKRAQHPPAVHRKGRYEVENKERNIGSRDPIDEPRLVEIETRNLLGND